LSDRESLNQVGSLGRSGIAMAIAAAVGLIVGVLASVGIISGLLAYAANVAWVLVFVACGLVFLYRQPSLGWWGWVVVIALFAAVVGVLLG
jgi:hypothetical protein